MYAVRIPNSVCREIRRLSRRGQRRIVAVLRALARDPRPRGARPVETAPRGTYRVRVGGYRIVYTVKDDLLLVVIARVG